MGNCPPAIDIPATDLVNFYLRLEFHGSTKFSIKNEYSLYILLLFMKVIMSYFSGGRGSRGGQTPAAAAKASTRGRGRGRASPAKKPLAMGVPVPNPGSASKKQPVAGKARGGGNNSIQNAFARQSRQSQAMSSTQNTVLEFDKIHCTSQCPRTDLSKRFLPKQMTTTG